MPIIGHLPPLAGVSVDALSNAPAAEGALFDATHELIKRINLTLNINSTAAQNASLHQDPWVNAGQYGLGWVYFCIVLLAICTAFHIYRLWTDKIRRGLHKEVVYEQQLAAKKLFQPRPYGLSAAEILEIETPQSSTSGLALFPPPPGSKSDQSSLSKAKMPSEPDLDSSLSLPIFHKLVARVRYWTYRPTPTFWLGKNMLSFAPANIILIVTAAVVFVILFCFVPQPYYYPSIADGSPPLAIRAGMLSVAMIPWIVALSMKVNLVSVMTGIGHERLSVLHRWGGYICLGLALIHTIPFYVQPVWNDGALQNYYGKGYFWQTSYVYGSGVAALVPLAFLCIHSLPILRSKLYELFVMLHIPASIVFLAMVFWHSANFLGSWGYLWATVAIWIGSLTTRIFFLNWAQFWRKSFLKGEAATVTVLPENAVKVTIPTQVRWRAGQFIYLRIPELSWMENHPFTVAALCDDRLPSEYGPGYRDMIVVFRPFGGFTRKLLQASIKNGPEHVYQAFVDGPHGGLQRDLIAFDTVVFVAGGSGITAVISHLLLLVHKMREQSAVTKKVHVIWAMKRPEAAEWFKEELRICKQFAPNDSVHCEFYITAAKRYTPTFSTPEPVKQYVEPETERALHERVDSAFAGLANKRNSALVREAAEGDPEKAFTFGREAEDAVKPLPLAHISPQLRSSGDRPSRRPKTNLKLQIPDSSGHVIPTPAKVLTPNHAQDFEFGFQAAPPPPPPAVGGDTKDVGPFSTTSTAVGSPPTVGKQNLTKGAFFSPSSTSAGSPPTSTTEQQRKFVSPLFYSEPESTSYFPKPATFGMQQTGAQHQQVCAVPPPAQMQPMNGGGRGADDGGSQSGWHTEYGRPDIPALLRRYERNFGKRAAIFVCGPESMRRDVQRCVAGMQKRVLEGRGDEVFLRVESYRL